MATVLSFPKQNTYQQNNHKNITKIYHTEIHLKIVTITLVIWSESGLTDGSIVSNDLTRGRKGRGVSPSIDSDIRLV